MLSNSPGPCPHYRPRPATNPLKDIVEDQTQELFQISRYETSTTLTPACVTVTD